MDTASLLEIAHSMSRERFIARFGNLFFMAAIDGGEVEAPKNETIQVQLNSPRAIAVGALASVAALESPRGSAGGPIELVKSPNDPRPNWISVGRALSCDVLLHDPSVSKHHADLRPHEPNAMTLTDLGSQNGTWLNAARLEANTPHVIRSGDLVTFGRVTGRITDAGALFDLLRG